MVVVAGCDKARRSPGHAYMPDMGYSVAFETYAPSEERLSKYGAHYNHQPVEGAIARGDSPSQGWHALFSFQRTARTILRARSPPAG